MGSIEFVANHAKFKLLQVKGVILVVVLALA
jgi:hypothetical protein